MLIFGENVKIIFYVFMNKFLEVLLVFFGCSETDCMNCPSPGHCVHGLCMMTNEIQGECERFHFVEFDINSQVNKKELKFH